MSIFSKKNKEKLENLEEVLSAFKILNIKVGELEKELKEIKSKRKFSIQRVGMLRYNPFSGVGGDQSFSIALLDENNNGTVITSLFLREGNRVYGKLIEKGKSTHSLSKEERQVIEQAMTQRIEDTSSN